MNPDIDPPEPEGPDHDEENPSVENHSQADQLSQSTDEGSGSSEPFVSVNDFGQQDSVSRDPNSKANPEVLDHEAPATIGRYEIVRQLGHGGFGYVYLANDPELYRQVAIKVPRWDRPLTQESQNRFLKQGKLLAQVEFPSIVAVHDLGVENDIPYVVMQYVEGKTLNYFLKRGKMDPPQRLHTLMQIAVALREAHKKSIVHRDLKPSNVIIDKKGRIHLVDFGMALHDDLTLGDFQLNNPAGTPQYMAPEQVRGENHRIDGRTDIWAFGVTMYKMLTGKMPFKAAGKLDLKRVICKHNPKPLRQRREWISKELERICLRCLHKLMDGRYQSMPDLIEELRAACLELYPDCLNGRPTDFTFDIKSLSRGHTGGLSGITDQSFGSFSGSQSGMQSYGSFSSAESLSIVPKGLRAFDENDHEFFVQLLPGPVDRFGVPESIRFWMARLGTMRQVEQIPIGVIWGPSGSGKTSFVRAGLLPVLKEEVEPVYVDCSTNNLPATLRRRMYRALGMPPHDSDLVSCMRKIRRREDMLGRKKVVIVLDHFERWWESSTPDSREEIANALRQCDFESLQCLILVRDDYWSSISEFMQKVEQPLIEHQNSAALTMLDPKLAKKILFAHGRASKRLLALDNPTENQQRFARQAIESITEKDQVLAVRLTILADMVAASDWENTNFKKTFGDDGIGAAYLAKHLTDSPRVTKKGWLPTCELIFDSLLPEATGTAVKAGVRRHSELAALAKLKGVDRNFQDCIHYLMHDLKLICQVETEPLSSDGESDGSEDSRGEPAYRLTHDFFVIAVRKWVRTRQAKTMSGRARSRFNELLNQFRVTKDPHFIPNFREYLQTLCFVRKRRLDLAGREFLSRTHRYYLKRFAVAAIVLLAGAFIALRVMERREAEGKLQTVLNGDTRAALVAANELRKNPDLVERELRESLEHADPKIAARARVMLAIIQPDSLSLSETKDSRRLNELMDSINDCSRTDLWLYHQLFSSWSNDDKKTIISLLKNEFQKLESENWFLKSRFAILLGGMGNFEATRIMLESAANPNPATAFVDEYSKWYGSPLRFADWLRDQDAIVQTNGLEAISFNADALPTEHRVGFDSQEFLGAIQDIYNNTDKAGTAVMAEFCDSHWDEIEIAKSISHPFFRLATMRSSSTDRNKSNSRNTLVDSLTAEHELSSEIEFRMILVPAGNFRDNVNRIKIEDSDGNFPVDEFWVLDTEVSVEMFKPFVESIEKATDPALQNRFKHFRAREWYDDPKMVNEPVRDLSPLDVVLYLNWLSKEHELDPSYEITDHPTEANPLAKRISLNVDASGYRLLRDYEALYLAMSGSALSEAHAWGNAEQLEQQFGISDPEESRERLNEIAKRYFSSDATNRSGDFSDVDKRAPNKWGVREMQGNVHELVLLSAYEDVQFGLSGGSIWFVLESSHADTLLPAIHPTIYNRVGFRFIRPKKNEPTSIEN